jgi:hypothetical protein
MQLPVFKNESENGYDYEILKLTELIMLSIAGLYSQMMNQA